MGRNNTCACDWKSHGKQDAFLPTHPFLRSSLWLLMKSKSSIDDPLTSVASHASGRTCARANWNTHGTGSLCVSLAFNSFPKRHLTREQAANQATRLLQDMTNRQHAHAHKSLQELPTLCFRTQGESFKTAGSAHSAMSFASVRACSYTHIYFVPSIGGVHWSAERFEHLAVSGFWTLWVSIYTSYSGCFVMVITVSYFVILFSLFLWLKTLLIGIVHRKKESRLLV